MNERLIRPFAEPDLLVPETPCPAAFAPQRRDLKPLSPTRRFRSVALFTAGVRTGVAEKLYRYEGCGVWGN